MAAVMAVVAGLGCKKEESNTTAAGAPAKGGYTCPMHPEVRSDKPGECPKCGMDLVPVKETGSAATGDVCPRCGKPEAECAREHERETAGSVGK